MSKLTVIIFLQSHGSTSIGSASADVQKQTDESKRLRDELATLRQENMQLREEGLKHRIRGGIPATEERFRSSDTFSSSRKPGTDDQQLMVLLRNPQVIAVAIVVFIFGLVFGKFVF